MNAGDMPGLARMDPSVSRWCVAIGFGCALAYMTWQGRLSLGLRGAPVSPVIPAATVQGHAVQADVGRASTPPLASVAGMHLFGVYRAPEVATAAPPVVVAETRLDFRLQGVFTSTDADAAAALIAVEGGGPARRFQPGDMLGAQAELVSVAMDHVVLRQGGELQRLSLHRAQPTASRPTPLSSRRTVRGGRRAGPSLQRLPMPEASRAEVVMARLRRLRAGGV